MDNFIYQDPKTGHRKLWCVDIHSPTELVVYFGAYHSSLRTKVIPCTRDVHSEMRKRIKEKRSKGYRDIDGYVNLDNKFVPDAPIKPKEKPKTWEPVQVIDLSKLDNESSFWF